MPLINSVKYSSKKRPVLNKTINPKPVALILAGYCEIDLETRKKRIKEMQDAYDGEVIYMGQNKFLHNLAGKPVIQYVIDAVFNARNKNIGLKKRVERLYDKIYVYNDIKTISSTIDLSKYPNLIIRQMQDSVGGHLRDFCSNYVNYGQRVDIFMGDTPRITPDDVEWLHNEYNNILQNKKDHRGVPISMIFGMVKFEDMKDNWMEHRLKYIKVGHNKGKLKYFLGFENFQARIGNSSALVINKCLNGLIEHEVMNFFYNLRKALTPSTISKIIYYLWKTKHFNVIKQIKRRCIIESDVVDTVIDVISKLYKIDLSFFGGRLFYIKKNASRWENDIDSPLDLEVLDKRFRANL